MTARNIAEHPARCLAAAIPTGSVATRCISPYHHSPAYEHVTTEGQVFTTESIHVPPGDARCPESIQLPGGEGRRVCTRYADHIGYHWTVSHTWEGSDGAVDPDTGEVTVPQGDTDPLDIETVAQELGVTLDPGPMQCGDVSEDYGTECTLHEGHVGWHENADGSWINAAWVPSRDELARRLLTNVDPMDLARAVVNVAGALGSVHDWDDDVPDAVWNAIEPVTRGHLPPANHERTVPEWRIITGY